MTAIQRSDLISDEAVSYLKTMSKEIKKALKLTKKLIKATKKLQQLRSK